MLGPIGFFEMAVIFFIALLVFGPEKLPDLAKTAAKGIRQFKKATEDLKANWDEHLRDVESPVHDLKQTFHEVRADVEASVTVSEDDPVSPASTEEPAAPAGPEEAKPDAN